MTLSLSNRVKTICRLCFARCGIILHLENGKLLKVDGNPNDSRSQGYLCPKGKAIVELVNAPDRLKYPLKRDGNTWQRISWDEALDVISRNLNEIKKNYGAQAVVIHMGHAGVAQDIRPLIRRFCNVFGTPNFSSAGSQCHMARVMGSTLTFGYLPVPDFENAVCIIICGANPASSNPLAMKSILKAKEKGANLIVIDPRMTPLAKKADMHLQIRPGTDGALALGMLKVIVDEKLYDRDFVEERTIGFDQLVKLLQEYPPERIEKITWIPWNVVKKSALLYGANKPACIMMGNALEHHTNGIQAIRAISILQAISGNLDIKGGAIFNQNAPLADISLDKEINLNTKPIGAAEYPLFYEFTREAQANLLPEAILSNQPYPIKAMIICGSNPILTWPNAEKTKKALKNIEFLVVMDLFLTETAKLAQIVLPSATYLERTELCDQRRYALDGRLELFEKVIAEKDECWPDWRFWNELARKMGYEMYFPWRTIEETIDLQLKPFGIPINQFRGELLDNVSDRREFKKYEREGFKTPSGKVEIYSEKLKRFGYDPLPAYKEQDESPMSKLDLAKEYPLILTTGARILEYIHSRFRNLPSLKNRVPEAWAEIHPNTANELGIRDGELVIIKSSIGSVEIRSKTTHDIKPGIVHISHGWDEANANILTNDGVLDAISGFPAFRSERCKLIKKETG